MWRIPFRDGAFPHTVDSLSSGSILHAAGISPSGGSLLHAAGISPSGGSILHAAGISPSGGSISHAAGISPSSGSILHAAHSLPGGAFSHAAVARRGSIHSCEGHTPLLALHPSRPRRCSALWNVLLCWRGDGFYGVGYCRLCRYR